MALLSDDAVISLFKSFEKKLNLLVEMVARQQSLIDDLTKKSRKTHSQNLEATNKKLRVRLAIQKQAYDELAAFMKVEEYDPSKIQTTKNPLH